VSDSLCELLTQIILEKSKNNSSKKLDEDIARKAASALISTRLFENECDPKGIVESIFSLDSYGTLVYPSEILELRPILQNNEINYTAPLPLFSYRFAEQYMDKYSVFITFSQSKINAECIDLGGMCVYEDGHLELEDALQRIVVNDLVDEKGKIAVANIVRDNNVPDFDILNSIQKPERYAGRDDMNWFQRVTTADASSPQDPGSAWIDHSPAMHDQSDETQISTISGPDVRKGDVLIGRGTASQYSDGDCIVVGVSNNDIEVEWRTSGKKEVLEGILADTVKFFMLFQRGTLRGDNER